MGLMDGWSEEAKEAAQLVIDKYGEPHEATDSVLIWNNVGPWRMMAYRDPDPHDFPAPHKDSVESFLECSVPTDKFSQIVEFDGSVVVNRTRGELSARCHDEEANYLALNLANDVMTGAKTFQQAREYYAQEFLAARKSEPTPYMEGLKFQPSGGVDRDQRMLTDEQLEKAVEEGKTKSRQ